ncbi:MAG: MmcQ/YjbR family DNA-binding protein [Mesorhizobium sp.]|uniref:MmcQ/YjbR family DNA-binding protein n=1 Tax=Mesorhizobium sp. TaxID=1871066 RepID=UPI001ACD57CA|nr:MmcQ/YjbR family DNA-binding protein [Mesorhizobium sp.]MBN9218193.1 MmcQ/YjbR family DNA-binding protein [Mesorhizobium sp.]
MAVKGSASPPDGDLSAAFDVLRRAAGGLLEIVETTSYGTPALKVGKKLIARVKDAETIVLMCPLDEKEMLLEAAPSIYFETDHYKGWPALLVRLSEIGPDELKHRLEQAWLRLAPKKLVETWRGAKG